MIRAAALALALAGCAPLPDRVIGVWDRIFANGVPIPAGVVDRLTATNGGRVTIERDGRVERGSWAEDLSSQVVTMTFDGDATTWRASRPKCVDGADECIRLVGAAEDDWYRFDWALYEQP